MITLINSLIMDYNLKHKTSHITMIRNRFALYEFNIRYKGMYIGKIFINKEDEAIDYITKLTKILK